MREIFIPHVKGEGQKKAEERAISFVSCMEDGKLKDLFVESIRGGLEVSDFKSRTMTLLAEEVAKKLNEQKKEGSHCS